ncbi:hypothetical protein CEXT_342151 [Caerostris extrusa]|uniref:Uncharacterized protein n=1 Tax=Caerostris extrusa TaxID=172846 RepID=A0AAV4MXX7_CAEEX|nr:hypothetical protein CEXT_342151 [Caerostris extrusa]
MSSPNDEDVMPFFHSNESCYPKSTMVSSAGNHLTKNCTLPIKIPKICMNCSGYHTAFWRGYLRFIRKSLTKEFFFNHSHKQNPKLILWNPLIKIPTKEGSSSFFRTVFIKPLVLRHHCT